MVFPSRRTTAGRPSTGGIESGEVKRLKRLVEENRKLKHVVVDLTLDNRALKDVLTKNFGQPLAILLDHVNFHCLTRIFVAVRAL
jgi:hypothetical protein